MSTPLQWNQLPWRYRTALNIYRFAILNQQDIRAVIASAGISMSAAFVKKIYSKYKNQLKMSFWSRRRQGEQAISRKVKYMDRKIRRLEKGYGKELKTYDQALENTPGTTGSFECITDMAQGDTSITREGLVIQPRHLQYKLITKAHASFSGTAQWLRVMIVQDTQQSGVAPTVAMLLESDTIGSWLQHDSRPRFRILRDFTITLPLNGNASKVYKGIIKFNKNAKINYQGTGTAAASMGKNNLYVYMLSNDNTNSPTSYFYSRMRFCDG